LADAVKPDVDEGAEMLARHIAGDERAFEELVRSFGGSVYGYLYRAGIDKPAADDLFQETFLRVHKAARRFDSRHPFRVWLFTIAHNLIRSHLRKKKVRRVLVGWFRRPAASDSHDDWQSLDPADESPGPQERVQARAEVKWLEKALNDLPEGPRRALILTQVEGLAYAEASRVLDVPVPTLKTWIRRGRLALTAALEEAQRESES